MSQRLPIDLSRLPVPDAVESLDYERLLVERKDLLEALAPELAPVLQLESEPLIKLLEVEAYRELILRAEVNDSVRAVMLASSTGADLEGLAALFGVARQIITEADPTAVPPVAAVYEDDASLRRRVQLAPEGLTNAGTIGSYTFHALRAHGSVRDVGISRPVPGQVLVTVLAHGADGMPADEVLTAVTDLLEDVRPLCDDVLVAAPSFSDFDVTATLQLAEAPGAEVVRASAETALAEYLEQARAVGRIVRRTAIIACLHREGVENVVLISPSADVDPGLTGVARAISVEIGTAVLP